MVILTDKKVYLTGIGNGTYEGLTIKAAEIIRRCDLIFGADRMLVPVEGINGICGKKINTYKADEILSELKENIQWKNACVLLSGDVGFYSGAKKLLERLSDYDVELVPGISTVSSFCARLGISWEELNAVSLHGREMNVIARIDTCKYTFCLLNGGLGVRALAQKLLYYGFENVVMHIGEKIGYPDEIIHHMLPRETAASGFGELLAVVVENENFRECIFPEIQDEEFIRGKVPMTKSEVRSIAIQKLGLTKKAVLYDIGAGTGSVGIQAAVCFPDSHVYAVEYKEEAIGLIESNKKKFKADNLEIISGKAPNVLSGLPVPTHAFIGGSAGNMRSILLALWEENPHTVIVISMLTLETLSEVMNIAEEYGIEPELVQIQVSRAKKTGNYHLMLGQNPVILIKLAP